MKEPIVIKFRNYIPDCTDYETYTLWLETARFVHPGRFWFCADCTPDYTEEMRSQGRCEHPEIHFYRKDGMLEGKIPSTRKRKTTLSSLSQG